MQINERKQKLTFTKVQVDYMLKIQNIHSKLIDMDSLEFRDCIAANLL